MSTSPDRELPVEFTGLPDATDGAAIVVPVSDVVPADPKAVSPKVTAGALGSLAAGVVLALLLALTTPEGLTLLGGLPPAVTFLVISALPPVVTFLAAYAKGDPARVVVDRG